MYFVFVHALSYVTFGSCSIAVLFQNLHVPVFHQKNKKRFLFMLLVGLILTFIHKQMEHLMLVDQPVEVTTVMGLLLWAAVAQDSWNCLTFHRMSHFPCTSFCCSASDIYILHSAINQVQVLKFHGHVETYLKWSQHHYKSDASLYTCSIWIS